jgi:ribosomal protein S18 acetylase RimI-like enzyme
MRSVSSLDIFNSSIQKVKLIKKSCLTNFFLDIPKMELWMRLNLIQYEDIGETVFFRRGNKGFSNLFFITPDTTALFRDIDLFMRKYSGELFVIDLVGKPDDVLVLSDVFNKKGFYKYTSLQRMSKITGNNFIGSSVSTNVGYAKRSSAESVFKLLFEYFDPIAEQIPLLEEIYNLADNNRIVIYSGEMNTIQGFMIYELNGLTSFLRYWFVHPDHRDKKIGSLLLQSFFNESNNTRRQIFWVISSNQNAIKRYEHYGFVKEELFDYVMINKNINYEGETYKNSD